MRPIVCYVTDRRALGDPTEQVLAKISAAMAADVDWIQIRERDLSGRDLLGLVRAADHIATGAGSPTRVLVNDRLDIALAAGTAGVHLGGASLPTREVVRWCRSGNASREFLVGVSCHSFNEAREAEISGANYVFFGPVFETPSKKSFGPPQGISSLAEVCRTVRIPVVAIGGVNEANATECINAGAGGIAAIRMFQVSREPETLSHIVAQMHNAG